jgi:hypothetical protein
MANLGVDLDRLLAEATLRQLDMFKEEVRKLREDAWADGYSSAVAGEPKMNNPYSKEN